MGREQGGPGSLLRTIPAPGAGLSSAMYVWIFGQSNGFGTQVSSEHGGEAVESGVTVLRHGVSETTWASMAGPAAKIAQLLMLEPGVASVHVSIEAVNGSYVSDVIGSQLANFYTQAKALGLTAADRVDIVWVGGENEANDSTGSLARAVALQDDLARMARIVLHDFPLARIHVTSLRTDNAAYQPLDATVIASIDAMHADRGSIGGRITKVATRTPTPITMADGVHYADGSGGTDLFAERVVDNITTT